MSWKRGKWLYIGYRLIHQNKWWKIKFDGGKIMCEGKKKRNGWFSRETVNRKKRDELRKYQDKKFQSSKSMIVMLWRSWEGWRAETLRFWVVQRKTVEAPLFYRMQSQILRISRNGVSTMLARYRRSLIIWLNYSLLSATPWAFDWLRCRRRGLYIGPKTIPPPLPGKIVFSTFLPLQW